MSFTMHAAKVCMSCMRDDDLVIIDVSVGLSIPSFRSPLNEWYNGNAAKG